MFKRFIKNKTGTTAIEYALIASLVSVAIATSIPQISAKLLPMFSAFAAYL